MPSQFAKFGLHDWMAHVPFEHAGVALGVLQALPHEPQFAVDVVVLVSQPFDATWSQSWKPELQLAIVHCPALQVGVALGRVQTSLQPPQLVGSVFVLTLQPVVYLPSQFAKPALQGPRLQMPEAQHRVAVGLGAEGAAGAAVLRVGREVDLAAVGHLQVAVGEAGGADDDGALPAHAAGRRVGRGAHVAAAAAVRWRRRCR